MAIKQDILSIMRQWAPEETAESWDNVGLQLDTKRDVERIAVILELNLDTWAILQQYRFDLIISHHPLIFDPIKSINHDNWSHQVLRDLVNQDIGFYVSHTNLDRAQDGVSQALLRQYNFTSISETDLVDGYGKHVTFKKSLDILDIEDHVPVVAKIVDNLRI